jgi:hypothetical protein
VPALQASGQKWRAQEDGNKHGPAGALAWNSSWWALPVITSGSRQCFPEDSLLMNNTENAGSSLRSISCLQLNPSPLSTLSAASRATSCSDSRFPPFPLTIIEIRLCSALEPSSTQLTTQLPPIQPLTFPIQKLNDRQALFQNTLSWVYLSISQKVLFLVVVDPQQRLAVALQ